jgi:hypothetical protein
MNIKGSKLYVAALFGVAFAMRATIGDAPISAEEQQTVGWVLNGVCTGLGVVLGPELVDGIKTVVGKLTGETPASN